MSDRRDQGDATGGRGVAGLRPTAIVALAAAGIVAALAAAGITAILAVAAVGGSPRPEAATTVARSASLAPAGGSTAVPPSAQPGSPGPEPATDVPTNPPSAIDGQHPLLVLSGQPGAMNLDLVEGPTGLRRLAVPGGAMTWVSAADDGGLLLTAGDGRAFIAHLGPTNEPLVWRRLEPTGMGPMRGPLAFGSLSPDGQVAAFVAADYVIGRDFHVVVVNTATGSSRAIHVAATPEAGPPQWINGRLLVLIRDRDDNPRAMALDPAVEIAIPVEGPSPNARSSGGWNAQMSGGSRSGEAPMVPGFVRAVTVASDGTMVAVASPTDGTITIQPVEAWLAGLDTGRRVVELASLPDGSTSAAWIALDRDGARLAVVRSDAGGDSVAVAIHAATFGWLETIRVPLADGADRAVVAWPP